LTVRIVYVDVGIEACLPSAYDTGEEARAGEGRVGA
jgi:hypothetical protein